MVTRDVFKVLKIWDYYLCPYITICTSVHTMSYTYHTAPIFPLGPFPTFLLCKWTLTKNAYFFFSKNSNSKVSQSVNEWVNNKVSELASKYTSVRKKRQFSWILSNNMNAPFHYYHYTNSQISSFLRSQSPLRVHWKKRKIASRLPFHRLTLNSQFDSLTLILSLFLMVMLMCSPLCFRVPDYFHTFAQGLKNKTKGTYLWVSRRRRRRRRSGRSRRRRRRRRRRKVGAGGGKKERQEKKRKEKKWKQKTNKHKRNNNNNIKEHVAKFNQLFKVRKLNLSCAYKHATDT
mgnify:CR=1 FL=1